MSRNVTDTIFAPRSRVRPRIPSLTVSRLTLLRRQWRVFYAEVQTLLILWRVNRSL